MPSTCRIVVAGLRSDLEPLSVRHLHTAEDLARVELLLHLEHGKKKKQISSQLPRLQRSTSENFASVRLCECYAVWSGGTTEGRSGVAV